MIPSTSELQYSSSVAKLIHWFNILDRRLSPVTLQLVPTDTCNLNCDFCSVKHRDGNELPFYVIKNVLGKMPFLGLRGVEITGGGEPTLYPKINETIEFCLDRELEVGLITNGTVLMRKVSPWLLQGLTWVRVSLNCLDYVKDLDLVGFPSNVTLGFSYVLNDRTTPETLKKVKEFANQGEYVRIVPDCLDLSKTYDFDLDHPKFYVQTKTSKSLTPIAPCRMGYLKPYLNSNGYFYWCSGVCLEEQRFPEMYRMGRWDEAERIWTEQEPFECHFSKCFWVEQNYLLDLADMPVKHEAFI